MIGKRLVSYRYMTLRACTAAATLGAGLLQTFVFARVLTPERLILQMTAAQIDEQHLHHADVGQIQRITERGKKYE